MYFSYLLQPSGSLLNVLLAIIITSSTSTDFSVRLHDVRLFGYEPKFSMRAYRYLQGTIVRGGGKVLWGLAYLSKRGIHSPTII